jgi:hypothetical protein
MSKKQVRYNMTYPRIITPEVHHLRAHYQRINFLLLIAIPILFLVNEFFFRDHLPLHRKSPASPISMLMLILNGEIPYPEAIPLRNLLMVAGILYAGIACLLPKWTLGPRGRILRSTLPMDLGELALAQFHVKNRTQHAVFHVWHLVLILLPIALIPILCCYLLNAVRS